MRNEYTDYIAHGHKYFAVVDLGKKNSKGTKQRRYFYSANEYKAYLQGKKTLDDKLLGGVSKVANKLSGVKAIGKGLASTAKAIKNTNREVKALKKQGYSEEAARDEIKAKSTNQAMKRAGLSNIGTVGYTSTGSKDSKGNYSFTNKAVIEGTDSRGKKYYAIRGSRQIAQAKDNNPASQKRAISEAENLAKTKTGRSNNMKTMISEQRGDINKERHEKNKANLKAHPEKSILNNPIRENFVERMVEKGINKANAEKLRDTIKSTVGNATSIAASASNIKNRMDAIQDAILSGDGKALNYEYEMDRMLDDSDSLLDDMENVAKNLPTIGTLVKAMEEDEAKWEKEKAERNAKFEKERAEREAEWNKKSAEHDAEMAKKQAEFEEAKKKIAEAADKIMSNRNDVSVLVDSTKKTLDTAIAGPKAVAGDSVDEYLKEHGMNKDEVSKEFLDELRENLKRNRK